MSLRVIRYLPIQNLPSFIQGLDKTSNRQAVIAVRRNGTYAVHVVETKEEAMKCAEYWYIKFGSAANIYINKNLIYGKGNTIEQEYKEVNNDKIA